MNLPEVLEEILNTRILFFSGKGGVGKSTLSALCAVLLAQKGRRVLWVEMSETPFGSHLFARYTPGYAIRGIQPGLWGFNLKLLPAVEEYLEIRFPIPFVARFLKESQLFRSFVKVLPGMEALVTLGKIWYEDERSYEGKRYWDHIVVDAPATGHLLDLLHFPQGVLRLIQSGPIATTAREMHNRFLDRSRTKIVLVTLLEELPVDEVLELYRILTEEIGYPVSALFLNQCYPSLPEDLSKTFLRSLSRKKNEDLFHLEEEILRRWKFVQDVFHDQETQRKRVVSLPVPMVSFPWIPSLSPSSVLSSLLSLVEKGGKPRDGGWEFPYETLG
jgi:anion-transporting  ArsA/GET3 family ATPase